VEIVDQEVRALMGDQVLRLLADRMARNVDPVVAARLWRFGEPTRWFTERMEWYWRKRRRLPAEVFRLENPAAPAKAVMALYQQKRELIEPSLGQK
jgi:hypothetical protein